MMHWETLFSNKRYGSRNLQNTDETRGEYLRDYDRLIFSSQFRRLQDKTQVFPLPGSIFVHNRLTHSLEVASVGRSLGRLVGEKIASKNAEGLSKHAIEFYKFALADVIQTGCIAHDIGNPPFGHSGEDAIRTFFEELSGSQKETLENALTDNQLADLKNFEGNANAFRVLSTIFLKAGLKLTYTTLASIVKYPIDSLHGFDKSTGLISTKKSGYFDAELSVMKEMAADLQMKTLDESKSHLARHPFVFLVEAADDICYRIIDLEDAFRLHILSFKEVEELLLPFFEGEKNEAYIKEQMLSMKDEKQKLSLLRAMLIGLLTRKCSDAFMANETALLNGEVNKSLIELIDEKSIKLIDKIDAISVSKIYNHKSVVEIEIAGFHVIGGLLKEFLGAILEPKSAKSKKMKKLIPEQFEISNDQPLYQNILSVLDFISGMTDIYAVDLYRKITGIQIPSLG
ncbi:deoxyguanosinetriphosphate triphosphohydrolase [Arcticibacterium luteifluviistationis]|uniref:Deoxyguanosinetriphosphate triphosphohydrolase n=2 Tax=Arcticibacterium luteifluviistationis TaxID=1784714 RepID=A0A2Z4GGM2_9BACT|nr:deoxyguanosinetriphosphate triphosphohydrolase [Arcticibacterium luteifluviistationis]